METGINYELFKDAYAIIDGIPENAIAFGPLLTVRGEALDRGTICSPAGWLAQHPAFNALGVTLADDGQQLLLDGEEQERMSTVDIMARVFAMPAPDTDRLFGEQGSYALEHDGMSEGLSDKRLWQHEARQFLKEQGQLDNAIKESLNTRRPFSDPANPPEIRTV